MTLKEYFQEKHGSREWMYTYAKPGESFEIAIARFFETAAEYIDHYLENAVLTSEEE